MVSIQKEIEKTIELGKKGCIIFPIDLAHLGSSEAVRQGLSRLVKENKLIRLEKGIYLHPEIDPEMGIIYPAIEDIATAIARRDKARIIPTGIYALNRLGFSTQIPLKALYLTDGSPRIVKIKNRIISFQKTNPKILSIENELLVMLVSALQVLKKDNISQEIRMKISEILLKNNEKDIFKELNKAPVWIAKLIKNIYNELATNT
jgi:hypothetical protein